MCETRCSSCVRETCDLVCLGKPEVFARAYAEVGGFGFEDIGALVPPAETPPPYVPLIHHGSKRDRPLKAEWAAVPLRALLQRPQGIPRPVAETAEELRDWFKLHPEAKVLLVGIDLDPEVERYWEWRREADLPEALTRLGITAAVVPNYSLSLRHPRPQHLFNRKRSLICAREWSARDIPTVPYLQAVTQADWSYWKEFLESHPEVSIVAKEFRTGLSNRRRGLIALHELARLQDTLRRPLHLLAHCGAQYRGELSRHFDAWTIVDSEPFMKAVHRRQARLEGRRVYWDPALGRPVDALLAHDVGIWRQWISGPVIPADRTPQPPKQTLRSTGQLKFLV